MWIAGDLNPPSTQRLSHVSPSRRAGASVDAPSGLPLFGALPASWPPLCGWSSMKEAIDSFLGSPPKSVETHAGSTIITRDKPPS